MKRATERNNIPTFGFRIALAATSGLLSLILASGMAQAEPRHGIAMHGEPDLAPGFDHLPYANPDAPKGGRIAFTGPPGTFDSLNPFILKGAVPDGLNRRGAFWPSNVWESLMVRSWDEPFTLYGHLAEFVEVPDDRSWVEFTMNPAARFSDGERVKAEDVVFSFNLLKDKGRPRGWIKKIDRVETVDGNKVRFTFGEDWDRELPLIVGLMPVFPEHAVDPETFGESGLTVHVGSGPYVIDIVDPGKSVILKRNPDYWAKDMPTKRGLHNFDEFSIEYFRESNALFEAFKKGLFDINVETNPTRWTTGYGFPAAAEGKVAFDRITTGTPKGMNGFVFNLRRPMFQDARVREALGYFLDFEWINQNLYENSYKRTGSYFEGSELSALGKPANDRERDLLAPFPEAVRADIMEGTYRPPVSDGSGRDRKNIRKALDLLAAAGYGPKDGKMVNQSTGEPLAFEILVKDDAEERLSLALQRAMAVVGIDVSVRSVDSAQYWERILNTREFDVMKWVYGASLSPGSEQVGRWSKIDADTFGRLNFAGISSPAIDAMIDALLSAKTQEEFLAAVRAYDRVLTSGFYVIPLFHAPNQWIARWARIQTPDSPSLYGAIPAAWWAEEQ